VKYAHHSGIYECMLTFVLDGEVWLTVSGRRHRIAEGHFEFVRLGQVYEASLRSAVRADDQVLSGSVFTDDSVLATEACACVVVTSVTGRREVTSHA